MYAGYALHDAANERFKSESETYINLFYITTQSVPNSYKKYIKSASHIKAF